MAALSAHRSQKSTTSQSLCTPSHNRKNAEKNNHEENKLQAIRAAAYNSTSSVHPSVRWPCPAWTSRDFTTSHTSRDWQDDQYVTLHLQLLPPPSAIVHLQSLYRRSIRSVRSVQSARSVAPPLHASTNPRLVCLSLADHAVSGTLRRPP